MQQISVEERRRRLSRRHRLAPGHTATDVVDATRSIVCLHGTDPGSVYLSAWARVDDFSVADLDRALYAERSLVKHLAMRRTLFVFPRDVLPWAQAAASNRVAAAERRRLVKEVEAAGLHPDGERWLSEVGDHVLAALASGREATSSELREEIPLMTGAIMYAPDKRWGGPAPVGPRVLTTLSAAGQIVRASNDGGWSTSRPRWASMSKWLGEELPRPTDSEGVTEMVRAWLRAFGPGTVTDLKWWLGSTVTAVRKALAEVAAEPVEIGGSVGYLLPDDLGPSDDVPPWAALLPSLDPTTMGWFERDWYLGPYKSQLFDTNGNAGSTAWWEGRIVGGWRQTATGAVELQVLEDVGAEGLAALADKAARLDEWLGGRRVLPRFPSPLSKAAPT